VPHVTSSASAPPQHHSAGPRSGKSARRRSKPCQAGNRSHPASSPRRTAPGWSLPELVDDRPLLDLGLLSRVCNLEVVAEVVSRPGLGQVRGLLPSALTVYLVLALCLFPGEAYQEILQIFWAAWFALDGQPPLPVPNKSSLCRARQRLGAPVMARLFMAIARPLATAETPGAFWRGYRVMAIDGFTMEVPQSELNEQAFGGQCSDHHKRVGLPQLRAVGLAECGTHALLDVEQGRYNDSERWLAAMLARSLQPGMLELADRGFFDVQLWRLHHQTGAHLLWRIKANVATKVLRALEDGTYIARVTPQKKAYPPGQRPKPVEVRVIEFCVQGSPELIRLATSLLDPHSAPAPDLARLYAERWECEGTYDELKTHQRGAGIVLRSRTPDGVRQELWAHLIVHFGARSIAAEAAMARALDPDRMSFVLTLRLIRRSLPRAPFPTDQRQALQAAVAELTAPRAQLHRRPRSSPRTVKRRRRRYRCVLKPAAGTRLALQPSITLRPLIG